MKKLFVLAALAALVVIPSCQQIDLGGKTAQPKIEKAPKTDVAKKVVINEGPAKDKGYKEIDLGDSGIYCIEKLASKADDIEVLTGTYSTSDGKTFILTGFGTIIIDGNNITIKRTGESDVTATCTQAEKLPESQFTTDIAHSWSIYKVDLSVTASGKNIGITKEGCDLEQIGKELLAQAEKLNVKIDNFDPNTLKGYNVKRLTVTSSKSFIIEFYTNPPAPFKADVSNFVDYKFVYEIKNGSGNEIINATAECEFIPKTETTAWLRVKVTNKDFSGYVIFMMNKADA